MSKRKDKITKKTDEILEILAPSEVTLHEAFTIISSMFYSLCMEIVKRIEGSTETYDKKAIKKFNLILKILRTFVNEDKSKKEL